MTSSYATLATVSLRHDYFSDGRCTDFQLRPTEETLAAMRGLHILSRMLDDTLVLLVKVDESGKTFQTLPKGLRLSFYLELTNTDFINYSNAPLSSGMLGYFSNCFHTQSGATRYLNETIPAFSAASSYVIGDMVANAGNVFEAIRPVSPGSHPTSDADYWQQRLAPQYVHPGNLILLSDGSLQLTVPSGKEFHAQVFGMNPQTLLFDQLVWDQTLSYTTAVTSLNLNLEFLPPAKYRVAIDGTDHFAYVDRSASYARVYGVVELFHCFDTGDDFAWLDAGGVPLAPDHELRFANRLAIWKYIARTTNVTAVENTSMPGIFEPGDAPKEFVSRKPLFLQQQPINTIRVMNGVTVLASRLANPPPDRIATCIEDGNKYFCAEMYLNY